MHRRRRGGRASAGLAPGGGGGGGAYSSITNLTLTPGAALAYKIGAGGAPGAPGEDTFFGDAAFATAKVGAKGVGFLLANVSYALQRPDLGKALSAELKKLL